MAFEDREYLRDEERRYGQGGGGWNGGGFRSGTSGLWAVKFLLIANIVVYLLQGTTGEVINHEFYGGATGALQLSLADIESWQLWRIVTYGFCHSANIFHIVFNMYGLWLFGKFVEPILGSKEFLLFFLTSVVVSGVAHLIWQMVTGSPAGAVGASGGVVAVVMLTARHFPTLPMLFMFVIPVQLQYLAFGFVLLDVLGAMNPASQTAHLAHLGGAAFGLMYFQFRWRLSGVLDAVSSPWQTFRARRAHKERSKQLQVFDPGDDDLRDEVDRILAKIHSEGEQSLTTAERETLERASRIFRGR